MRERRVIREALVRLGTTFEEAEDGFRGALDVYRFIATWGAGWDHVSVHLAYPDRCGGRKR